MVIAFSVSFYWIKKLKSTILYTESYLLYGAVPSSFLEA